jgi:hypothetical protein
VYVANEQFTVAQAEEAITEGAADAVAFGVKFIANPDLPARIKTGALLNEPDPETFYVGGAKGYVDYADLTAGRGLSRVQSPLGADRQAALLGDCDEIARKSRSGASSIE